MEERAAQEGKKLETVFTLPDTTLETIEIKPGLLKLSKTSAVDFHARMKEMIYETGNGLWNYIAFLKFAGKVNDVVFGNSSSKTPEDKDFIDYLRTEVSKYGKGEYQTPEGVKFKNCETGTQYNYEQCNDQVLVELYAELVELKSKIKEREDFLKNVPGKGMDILDPDTGAVETLYPPSKKSKSSVTVTLPK